MTDDLSTLDRLTAEGLIGMGATARAIDEMFADRGDKRRPTHPSTPLRWATRGHQLPDGTRVKLEAVRISKRWHTSRCALLRFFARQQPFGDAAPAVRSPAERQRADDATRRELDALGAS